MVRMFAIRDKKTKRWVCGTDYTARPIEQKTSIEKAITYESKSEAEVDFDLRYCGDGYEIVQVRITPVIQ